MTGNALFRGPPGPVAEAQPGRYLALHTCRSRAVLAADRGRLQNDRVIMVRMAQSLGERVGGRVRVAPPASPLPVRAVVALDAAT